MIEEVRIPDISENVESGKVVEVLVLEGDMVDVDEVIIEFETEKAVVEIPSPVKGKVIELFAKAGAEMQVGDVLARVDTAVKASAETEEEPGLPKAAKEEETEEIPEEASADETADGAGLETGEGISVAGAAGGGDGRACGTDDG